MLALRRPHAYPLTLAIALALLLKALILFALWQACFAAPRARHMRMPAAAVEQHLLAPTPPAERKP